MSGDVLMTEEVLQTETIIISPPQFPAASHSATAAAGEGEGGGEEKKGAEDAGTDSAPPAEDKENERDAEDMKTPSAAADSAKAAAAGAEEEQQEDEGEKKPQSGSAEKKERKPRAKRQSTEPAPPVDTGRPKRQHKAVEHFSSTAFDKSRPASAPFVVTAGKGSKLRDIENVEHRISLTRTTSPSLILLHRVLFPSHRAHPTKHVIKSHVRDFSGWTGDNEEEEARSRLEKKEVKDVRALAAILDVSSSGSKKEIIDRIVEFCQRPRSSGGAFKAKKGKKRSSSGGGGGSAKKKAKTSSRKGKKGGGGGGRSHNPYLLFVNERRQAGMGGLSVAEFGKQMGEEWRALDDDSKDVYKKKAAEMKKEEGGGDDDDEEENGDEDGEDEEEEDEEGEDGDEKGEEKEADDEEADGEDKEEEEEEEGEDEEGDGDAKGRKGSEKKRKKEEGESEQSGAGEEEQEEDGADGGVLEKLRASIARILGDGDLTQLSVNKVREQLTLEHGEELVSRFKSAVKKIVDDVAEKAKNAVKS